MGFRSALNTANGNNQFLGLSSRSFVSSSRQEPLFLIFDLEDFTDFLNLLLEGEDLTPDEAAIALEHIIYGRVNEAQAAAFLFGMRQKGESIEELTAFVEVMRKAAVPVKVDVANAVDLCGTGGDKTDSFNISTAAMFVAAGAGVPVLKHGNRSVSSKSGSADVLESLGVAIELKAPQVEACFREVGIGFMFAPLFHPAMKNIMPARRNLGLRTFFNILGPLLNPAGVKRQIVGTYDQPTAEKCIQILTNLDTEEAITVHSVDGMDEFTTTAKSYVYRYKRGGVVSGTTIDPTELGFNRCSSLDIAGGDAQVNADIIRAVLQGHAPLAQSDIVQLNAAYAILVSGMVGTIEEALEKAKTSIRSGMAQKKLDQLIECSNDVSRI